MHMKKDVPLYDLDATMRERFSSERYPKPSVDGDYPGDDYEDDDTQCIDADGFPWPEHDESGLGECRRCGAELEV